MGGIEIDPFLRGLVHRGAHISDVIAREGYGVLGVRRRLPVAGNNEFRIEFFHLIEAAQPVRGVDVVGIHERNTPIHSSSGDFANRSEAGSSAPAWPHCLILSRSRAGSSSRRAALCWARSASPARR